MTTVSAAPHRLLVPIELSRAKRGVVALQPLMGGIVKTSSGPAFVELLLSVDTEDAPEPARFHVLLRSDAHPTGVFFELDATDLLEWIAEAYFTERPGEQPVASPPER